MRGRFQREILGEWIEPEECAYCKDTGVKIREYLLFEGVKLCNLCYNTLKAKKYHEKRMSGSVKIKGIERGNRK